MAESEVGEIEGMKRTHCWLTDGTSHMKSLRKKWVLQMTNYLLRNPEIRMRIAVPADSLILARY